MCTTEMPIRGIHGGSASRMENHSPRGINRNRSIAIFALQILLGECSSKRINASSKLCIADCGGIRKFRTSETGGLLSPGYQRKVEFTGELPSDCRGCPGNLVLIR